MTRIERNRQKFFQSKLQEPMAIKPEFEHYPDGTRQYSSASYEGPVYACACGELFVDKNDLHEHIACQYLADILSGLEELGICKPS